MFVLFTTLKKKIFFTVCLAMREILSVINPSWKKKNHSLIIIRVFLHPYFMGLRKHHTFTTSCCLFLFFFYYYYYSSVAYWSYALLKTWLKLVVFLSLRLLGRTAEDNFWLNIYIELYIWVLRNSSLCKPTFCPFPLTFTLLLCRFSKVPHLCSWMQ